MVERGKVVRVVAVAAFGAAALGGCADHSASGERLPSTPAAASPASPVSPSLPPLAQPGETFGCEMVSLEPKSLAQVGITASKAMSELFNQPTATIQAHAAYGEAACDRSIDENRLGKNFVNVTNLDKPLPRCVAWLAIYPPQVQVGRPTNYMGLICMPGKASPAPTSV